MRNANRVPTSIFPVLVTPIEREMLSSLSRLSGLSRGEVLRRLLLRETAQRQLAPREKTFVRSDR